MKLDLKNVLVKFQYNRNLKYIKYIPKFDQNGYYLLIKCNNPRLNNSALKLLDKNLHSIERSFAKFSNRIIVNYDTDLKRAEVIGKLEEMFLEQCNRLGIIPPRLIIKKYKSRWGSCHSGKGISLNYYLFFLPPELINAVICHELAHLSYANHSSDFKNLLNQYLSGNRKILESELKRYYLEF